VKSVISRPEFAYETSTDIAVYREKVYEWCKILAEENLILGIQNSMVVVVAIQDYFAVMETLSYHDLSLVIKFEYNLDFGNER
jgi:acyl-CoA oxidase